MSLGTYLAVSLKDARKWREEAKILANRVDPGHRQAVKSSTLSEQSNPFEVVAREWYAKHRPH